MMSYIDGLSVQFLYTVTGTEIGILYPDST